VSAERTYRVQITRTQLVTATVEVTVPAAPPGAALAPALTPEDGYFGPPLAAVPVLELDAVGAAVDVLLAGGGVRWSAVEGAADASWTATPERTAKALALSSLRWLLAQHHRMTPERWRAHTLETLATVTA